MNGKWKRLREIAAGLVLAGTMAAGGLPIPESAAHPHVWATSKSSVVYKDRRIVGLRHEWRFDEGFTEGVLPEFDSNKDGKLSKEELFELVKLNMDALKEFGFFTVVKSGDTSLALDKPVDFSMVQDGKELVLTFTVLLKAAVGPEQAFAFTVEDPTYYTHFQFAERGGVALGSDAPPGCKVKLEARPKKSADEQQKLEEAFATELGAAGLALGNDRMAHVRCSSPS